MNQRLFIRTALLIGAVACSCATALAQPNPHQRIGVTIVDRHITGYRFESITFRSEDGERRYRIRLAIPTSQSVHKGHPLIWLLDGNAALMTLDEQVMAKLVERGAAPVLAFVASDNDLRIDGDVRAYDYTPRRPGSDGDQKDIVPGRRNGGADAFLQLLNDRALPEIEARARIDRQRTAIWGHSYGGLFVLHALLTKPQWFATYAAADPSMWWGQGAILRAIPRDAQHLRGKKLIVWRGIPKESEPAATHHASTAMREARASVPPTATQDFTLQLRKLGVDAQLRSLPGLNHGQTLGASLRQFLLSADTLPP